MCSYGRSGGTGLCQPATCRCRLVNSKDERKERTHVIRVNPPSLGNCTCVGHSANSMVGEWHTDTWEVWGKVCYWQFCSPNPMLKPWPLCDGLRLQVIGGVVRIGLSWWDLCPQSRESRTLSLSPLSPRPLPVMRGHSQKMAVCKPGRGLSLGTNHAGILISNFYTPELEEEKKKYVHF